LPQVRRIRGGSSVGQSSGLIIRRSQVRVLPAPPRDPEPADQLIPCRHGTRHETPELVARGRGTRRPRPPTGAAERTLRPAANGSRRDLGRVASVAHRSLRSFLAVAAGSQHASDPSGPQHRSRGAIDTPGRPGDSRSVTLITRPPRYTSHADHPADRLEPRASKSPDGRRTCLAARGGPNHSNPAPVIRSPRGVLVRALDGL
jgi:hypothetical protein